MTALPKKKTYTPEEYLALEDEAEFRSEYDDGIITPLDYDGVAAMAGGSLDHAQISSNIARFVGNKISLDCRALQSEIKIWVESYRKFYYPDVTVLCGEPSFYKKRNDTITNPILIFEVLSKSTEARDRGEKFAAYQSLESLQEYVLVSQDKAKIEKFRRQDDESWKYQATIGLKSKVYFESVEIELSLEEVYQRVKL